MYLSAAKRGSPENILAAFRAQPEQNRDKGLSWYRQAHVIVLQMADILGLPPDIVAAVIAIASPGLAWRHNLRQAAKAIQLHQAGLDLVAQPLQIYPNNRARITRVLTDLDTGILRGPKTIAFYHNLAHPEQADHVTIDRHAARIWLAGPDWPKEVTGSLYFKAGTYQAAAADYRQAASTIGVLPHELQAATWVTAAQSADHPQIEEIIP